MLVGKGAAPSGKAAGQTPGEEDAAFILRELGLLYGRLKHTLAPGIKKMLDTEIGQDLFDGRDFAGEIRQAGQFYGRIVRAMMEDD